MGKTTNNTRFGNRYQRLWHALLPWSFTFYIVRLLVTTVDNFLTQTGSKTSRNILYCKPNSAQILQVLTADFERRHATFWNQISTSVTYALQSDISSRVCFYTKSFTNSKRSRNILYCKPNSTQILLVFREDSERETHLSFSSEPDNICCVLGHFRFSEFQSFVVDYVQ